MKKHKKSNHVEFIDKIINTFFLYFTSPTCLSFLSIIQAVHTALQHRSLEVFFFFKYLTSKFNGRVNVFDHVCSMQMWEVIVSISLKQTRITIALYLHKLQ